MTATRSLIRGVPRPRGEGSGHPVARLRTSSLYARVLMVNAACLIAAQVVLVLTPATVSAETTAEEVAILGGGLAVMVVANAVLLKVSFTGLTALVRWMDTLDVLQGRERVPPMGGAETRALITGFNTMLDRLEEERRASVRRSVTSLEAERQRIGRELHDEIGQRLTGILLQLGRVQAEAPSMLQPRIAGVQNQARATLDAVGALAWEVRPGVLEDLGLAAALEVLADSLREDGTAQVNVALLDPVPHLTREVELAVYRIAQEALTNAVRHSGASAITIELQLAREGLLLQVTDNGRGLTRADTEGPGLRGMRERALLVGGRLRIQGHPPGVRVELAVPTAQPAV
jgi:two-component system, NarL family, sensor histidine kinase UhpB